MFLKKTETIYTLEEAKQNDIYRTIELFLKKNQRKILLDLHNIYNYESDKLHIKKYIGETNTGFLLYTTNNNDIKIAYDGEDGYKLIIQKFQILYDKNGNIKIRT